MKAVKGRLYFGGVHPKGAKALSENAPIETLPPPEVVAISTAQSLGKPAVPVAEVGQRVK
ncbi:MAG: hypothetical protein K2I20_02130, partial [Clostridia bacterium]|nr:hypothetical protein [Clostridia bacterium]